MTVPNKVRDGVRDRLWKEADRLDWSRLSDNVKSKYYSQWTEAANIGGELAAYMDARKVRVYIKDTLLKSYTRERLAETDRIFRAADLEPDAVIVEKYIKPHGRRLEDGRVIAWGRASNWKLTMMAVFERAYRDRSYVPFACILLQSSTTHSNPSTRDLVEKAANQLDIKKLIWLD